MVTKFNHIFFLKKPRNYKEGHVPVYLRITVDGKRVELSTRREIDPSQWNLTNSLKGKSEAMRGLKVYLDILQAKLYEAHQALIMQNKPITAETLKNKYTGAAEKQRMLVPICQKHNDEMAALVPQQYANGTLVKYKTGLLHTKEFLKWKYSVSDIAIEAINHEFIMDFDFYLRSICKCANNTAIKYIKNLKKIIRGCIANGWLEKDPFISYRPKISKVERAYLTEEELNQLLEKEFTIDRLTQVKDIFLFSCFTGLAYSDVKKMSNENISVGIDKERWLFINRTKTNTSSRVPLLAPALEILEKYKDFPQCIAQNKLLPVSSNQKMNAYLKEIADICGIQKELTYHIARHTFATTVTLNNNVPIESVSKMLGHESIKTTQHYAKLLDKKVSSDMQSIRTKYKGNLNPAKDQKAVS